MAKDRTDFLNAIWFTKENLFTTDIAEMVEKEYSPFLITRSLSYFLECVFYANELNTHPSMDKNLHFNFLRLVLPKKKKPWCTWEKSTKDEDVKLIQSYYNCNILRAKEYMNILKPEDIEAIKVLMFTGGAGKKR